MIITEREKLLYNLIKIKNEYEGVDDERQI